MLSTLQRSNKHCPWPEVIVIVARYKRAGELTRHHSPQWVPICPTWCGSWQCRAYCSSSWLRRASCTVCTVLAPSNTTQRRRLPSRHPGCNNRPMPPRPWDRYKSVYQPSSVAIPLGSIQVKAIYNPYATSTPLRALQDNSVYQSYYVATPFVSVQGKLVSQAFCATTPFGSLQDKQHIMSSPLSVLDVTSLDDSVLR